MTDEQRLSKEDADRLVAAAADIRRHSYAPYSRYRVGAAILSDDGRLFTGVNVENASYGLTVCAERSAVSSMIAAGSICIAAVAVCSENGVAPCGACRQVLSEFVPPGQDIPVIVVDGRGNTRQTTLCTLMPERFGPEHLE